MKKIAINILMTQIILSCLSGQKTEKLNIKWQPGFNAPKYYPGEVVYGVYVAGSEDDEKMCGIANRACKHDGWGEGGLEMSDADFVPERLVIKWFSFAEDKFYKGEFQLPSDTMRALFKQGYLRSNRYNSGYNYLVVNVYPKGGVALWMKAGGKRTVEIAHFQGEEMEYNWKSIYPDMEMERSDFAKWVMDRVEGGQQYLATHGISQEPFKTVYRQRYNYTIEIDSVTHLSTEFVLFQCYNGEQDVMERTELDDNFFKKKAVPKYVYFSWLKNGVVYFGKFYPNEEEIFNVFAEMSAACPDEPYVLYCKPDFATRKVSVSLRSLTKEIELEKTGVMGKSLIQDFANDKHQK